MTFKDIQKFYIESLTVTSDEYKELKSRLQWQFESDILKDVEKENMKLTIMQTYALWSMDLQLPFDAIAGMCRDIAENCNIKNTTTCEYINFKV